MGWGNCGDDSNGRPIGYNFGATCDHEGCKKEIHRGLAYVCGLMHGEDTHSCEKYICDDHKEYARIDGGDLWICKECFNAAKEAGALEPETFE